MPHVDTTLPLGARKLLNGWVSAAATAAATPNITVRKRGRNIARELFFFLADNTLRCFIDLWLHEVLRAQQLLFTRAKAGNPSYCRVAWEAAFKKTFVLGGCCLSYLIRSMLWYGEGKVLSWQVSIIIIYDAI